MEVVFISLGGWGVGEGCKARIGTNISQERAVSVFRNRRVNYTASYSRMTVIVVAPCI
jgi:hypothetical protein